MLDSMWLSSYFVADPTRCPMWGGFNQTVVTQGNFDISRIDILPFINHDPSQPGTLYSALSFVQQLSVRYNLGVSSVTFDQPLYSKATEIVESCPDLTNVFIRLGGFHLIMSYMGSVGHILNGSGLRNQWETVYAKNSVNHMLTGHAYARALRAHMLSAASIMSEMLDTPHCLSGVNISKIESLLDTLLKYMSTR